LTVVLSLQSAKYIDVLSKTYSPKEHHPLAALKQILSTGSPLKPELFSWVYANVKADVLLASITGGMPFHLCCTNRQTENT
jgi:acetoacetyl-CoA synthetase